MWRNVSSQTFGLIFLAEFFRNEKGMLKIRFVSVNVCQCNFLLVDNLGFLRVFMAVQQFNVHQYLFHNHSLQYVVLYQSWLFKIFQFYSLLSILHGSSQSLDHWQIFRPPLGVPQRDSRGPSAALYSAIDKTNGAKRRMQSIPYIEDTVNPTYESIDVETDSFSDPLYSKVFLHVCFFGLE